MHIRKAVALLVILMCATAQAAVSLGGNWEYTAEKPDPTYGNEESLSVRMNIENGVACGTYVSAWRGGMRVAEGGFRGKVNGSRVAVTYEAGWGAETGEGLGEFSYRSGKLYWRVLRAGPGTDYMVRSAVLKRIKSTNLGESSCAKS
jgi:hypothetical protein